MSETEAPQKKKAVTWEDSIPEGPKIEERVVDPNCGACGGTGIVEDSDCIVCEVHQQSDEAQGEGEPAEKSGEQ